jgi:regulator of sigma E protease
MTNLAWLVVLLVVIFIHELGHFLVARWCGVKVDTFSIGFGREIAGFTDKHGTRWKFGWMPLGGYVKFMDDENGASMPAKERLEKMTPEQRAGSFHAKPLWQRAAVVAAGPAANFLSAILMFAAGAYVMGTQITAAEIEPAPDGPAARAGFKAGDVITRIDDTPIRDFSGLLKSVSLSQGRELTIEVSRNGTPIVFKVTPERKSLDDGFGGKETRPVIGVRPHAQRVSAPVVYPSLPGALWIGAEQTWKVIADTVTVLSHPEALEKVGGLPTVIDVSNKIATYGIMPLVQLTAILSVSIGFINLLPIPLLDGGHLMFYAAEAVRGRPLSERAQEFGYRIGFAVVCSLMVLALWNDRFRVCKWLGVNCSG